MTKRRQHPSVKKMKIQALALESVVEISIAVGNDGSKAFQAADTRNGNAPSDVVRENIIAAAMALSKFEVRDEDLWSRNDWRETCDAIAAVIVEGGVVDVPSLLR